MQAKLFYLIKIAVIYVYASGSNGSGKVEARASVFETRVAIARTPQSRIETVYYRCGSQLGMTTWLVCGAAAFAGYLF
jgi:hypothetical protein